MSDASRQLEAMIGDLITGNSHNHYSKTMSGDSGDATGIMPQFSGGSYDNLLREQVATVMGGGSNLKLALASAVPSGTSFSSFTELSGNGYDKVGSDSYNSSHFEWGPVIKVDNFSGEFSLYIDIMATVSGDGTNGLSGLKTTFVDSSAGEIVFGEGTYMPDGMGFDTNETLTEGTSGETCETNWAGMVTPIYTNCNDITFDAASGGDWTAATHAIICYDDGMYAFPYIKCAFDSPVTVEDSQELTIKAGKLRFSIA